MRFFKTASPIKPALHYPVLLPSRLDVDDLLLLIRPEKSRQTGKTSALFALKDALNVSDYITNG